MQIQLSAFSRQIHIKKLTIIITTLEHQLMVSQGTKSGNLVVAGLEPVIF